MLNSQVDDFETELFYASALISEISMPEIFALQLRCKTVPQELTSSKA